MKILIVDDDNIAMISLCEMLKKMDIRNDIVGTFSNGKLALEYIENNKDSVELVITEIKMPVMTGIELIRYVNENRINIPLFVVLSRYDKFSYVRDSMKEGALNYLLKPISLRELKIILEEAQRKIDEINNSNKLYKKSIEILKKDFLKRLLFYKADSGSCNENILSKNIKFSKLCSYKLIIIDIDLIKENEKVVSKYIKNVLSIENNIEYCSFHYQGLLYIIFYINKEHSNIHSIMKKIEDESNIFAKNKIQVYIFKNVNEVCKLREQAETIRRSHKKSRERMQYQKHYMHYTDKSFEVLDNDEDINLINVIRLAKKYIMYNYDKNITLKDVADKVYLSQNYLSELFKRETGEGFYEFLSRYRMERAKEILLATNLKVYEIAEKVGYNDSISFGRTFKRIVGVAPNYYRKENMIM